MSSIKTSQIVLTPEGKKFAEQIKRLAKTSVAVGFSDSSIVYDNGSSLVEVATENELGSSTRPARPFMKQSWKNGNTKLANASATVCESIADGGNAATALDQLGRFGKEVVQNEISTGHFAANSEATIKRKGSNRPLIDTGLMLNSVNYKVREGN